MRGKQKRTGIRPPRSVSAVASCTHRMETTRQRPSLCTVGCGGEGPAIKSYHQRTEIKRAKRGIAPIHMKGNREKWGKPFTAMDAAMSSNRAAEEALMTFRLLWDMCQREIQRESEQRSFGFRFQVPLLHPDVPVYDVGMMAEHIAQALRGIGYEATVETPADVGVIRISWDHVRKASVRKIAETHLGDRAAPTKKARRTRQPRKRKPVRVIDL